MGPHASHHRKIKAELKHGPRFWRCAPSNYIWRVVNNPLLFQNQTNVCHPSPYGNMSAAIMAEHSKAMGTWDRRTCALTWGASGR